MRALSLSRKTLPRRNQITSNGHLVASSFLWEHLIKSSQNMIRCDTGFESVRTFDPKLCKQSTRAFYAVNLPSEAFNFWLLTEVKFFQCFLSVCLRHSLDCTCTSGNDHLPANLGRDWKLGGCNKYSDTRGLKGSHQYSSEFHPTRDTSTIVEANDVQNQVALLMRFPVENPACNEAARRNLGAVLKSSLSKLIYFDIFLFCKLVQNHCVLSSWPSDHRIVVRYPAAGGQNRAAEVCVVDDWQCGVRIDMLIVRFL